MILYTYLYLDSMTNLFVSRYQRVNYSIYLLYAAAIILLQKPAVLLLLCCLLPVAAVFVLFLSQLALCGLCGRIIYITDQPRREKKLYRGYACTAEAETGTDASNKQRRTCGHFPSCH